MPEAELTECAEPWDKRMLAAIQGGAKEHPERPENPWLGLIHLPFAGLTILLSGSLLAWVPLVCVWALGFAFSRRRARRRLRGSRPPDAFGR